jgi:hypothetical protein
MCTEQTSIAAISAKRGVLVNSTQEKIVIDKHAKGLGLGTWKHIDFLINHCGYRLERKM